MTTGSEPVLDSASSSCDSYCYKEDALTLRSNNSTRTNR